MATMAAPRNEPLLPTSAHPPRTKQDVEESLEEIRVLLGHGANHYGFYPINAKPRWPLPPPGRTPEDLAHMPPEPLQSRVDQETWKRFQGQVSGVQIKSMLGDKDIVGISGQLASYLWPPFLAVFIAGHIVRSDVVDTIVSVLTWLLIGLEGHSYYVLQPRANTLLYNKILTKMQPTFRAKGFHVELGQPFWDYCCCNRRYFVIFTPLPGDVEWAVPSGQEQDSDDDVGPYHPPDWLPLEGTWVRVSAGEPKNSLRLLPFLYGDASLFCCKFSGSQPSVVWTISDTQSPQSFVLEKTGKLYIFHLCPKKVTSTYQVEAGSNAEYLNAVDFQPSNPNSRIQQAMRQDMRLRPMHRSHHTTNMVQYYLQGTQTVWRVTVHTLTQYSFEFWEDMPTREEILRGALERLSPEFLAENCVVWEFEREATVNSQVVS